MEVMKDMGMTDSQYKSMRRRDKKELERILEEKWKDFYLLREEALF